VSFQRVALLAEASHGNRGAGLNHRSVERDRHVEDLLWLYPPSSVWLAYRSASRSCRFRSMISSGVADDLVRQGDGLGHLSPQQLDLPTSVRLPP